MRDAGPAPAFVVAAHRRAGWHARLALGFAKADARTRLVRRAHEGPLVVQKPLYPEGEDVCQCIVVHPPGGIAGGDHIELSVDVEAGAHVQLTTPGATRWYRNAGAPATQSIAFHVEDGAVLEWLPQGTIVFDGAHAASDIRVELDGTACYIGWDVVCLGRTASSERCTHGRWRQRCDIERDSALIWSERMVLDGNSPWLLSPAGLNGAPVFGTFVAMSSAFDDSTLDACRALAPMEGDGAVTRLPGSLVARYRGASSEAANAYFSELWSVVRPCVTGRHAVVPRIWAT
jgi:urease accessory protein